MEVKIKNITVSVDDQEFSFTAKSLAPAKPYDPATDPEVQGKSLADVQAEVAPVAVPAEEPVEVEAPVETPIEVPAEPAPVVEEPVAVTE